MKFSGIKSIKFIILFVCALNVNLCLNILIFLKHKLIKYNNCIVALLKILLNPITRVPFGSKFNSVFFIKSPVIIVYIYSCKIKRVFFTKFS